MGNTLTAVVDRIIDVVYRRDFEYAELQGGWVALFWGLWLVVAKARAFTDDGSTNDMVYANLPAVDLTGAWVQIMAGEAWVGYSRQIAAHDRASGRLTFASPINQTSVLIPRRNNRFFIFGKLELLDEPGEWWWDPAGQQLYVWTPDGAPPASFRIPASFDTMAYPRSSIRSGLSCESLAESCSSRPRWRVSRSRITCAARAP